MTHRCRSRTASDAARSLPTGDPVPAMRDSFTQARSARDVAQPGDVRGRGRQRADHAPVAARPRRRRRATSASSLQIVRLAVVHRAVRQLRRGDGRGARQGPGRDPAGPADRARREAPGVDRTRNWRDGAGLDACKRGDRRAGRGGRPHPGGRRGHRGRRLGRRGGITGESAPVIRESGGDRSRSPAARGCSPTGSSCASPPTPARPSSTA